METPFLLPDSPMQWSFTRLSMWENCPRQMKLRYIDKHEPIRGTDETAADRGTKIHKQAEEFIQSDLKTVPKPLAKFDKEFLNLQTLHKQGNVFTEQLLCFDRHWNLCDNDDNAWLRVIIDAFVTYDTGVAIIDFKTGKAYGNEVKHGKQTQLYGIAALLAVPTAEELVTELWYLDKGICTAKTTPRLDILKLQQSWDNRAEAMMADTEFPATPNVSRCLFCPWAARENKWVIGTGDCKENPPDARNTKYWGNK